MKKTQVITIDIADELSECRKLKKQNAEMLYALKAIKDAFWSEGEANEEKIDDLKSIAISVLKKIES